MFYFKFIYLSASLVISVGRRYGGEKDQEHSEKRAFFEFEIYQKEQRWGKQEETRLDDVLEA